MVTKDGSAGESESGKCSASSNVSSPDQEDLPAKQVKTAREKRREKLRQVEANEAWLPNRSKIKVRELQYTPHLCSRKLES